MPTDAEYEEARRAFDENFEQYVCPLCGWTVIAPKGERHECLPDIPQEEPMNDYHDLLERATRRAEYTGSATDGNMIRELVVAIEQLTAPVLERTLNEVYEQNEQLIALASGNQSILKSWGEELQNALIAEGEEQDDDDTEQPPTGVHLLVFYADGETCEVPDIDGVHVMLQDGTIPFAYTAIEDGGRRKPGYIDAEGDFHPFDDRRAARRGW